MKTILSILAIIYSVQVFSFERIGTVVEKDTLFHYDNYDRVRFHKERNKEYRILSEKLAPYFKKNEDTVIKSNIEAIANIPVKIDSIAEERRVEPKLELIEPQKSFEKGHDPLIIEEEDVINLSI